MPSPRLLLARATLGFLSGAAAVEVAFMADLTSKTDRADWVNMQTSPLAELEPWCAGEERGGMTDDHRSFFWWLLKLVVGDSSTA